MKLIDLQKNWNSFGKTDPLWSILTRPDKKGGRWEVEEFFATGRDEISRAMQHIAALQIELPRRRALDFGCGVGRLSQALCQHFEEVYGVDIAVSMIEHANSHNLHGKRCKYFVNTASDLNLFHDASFDLVFSMIVLQHVGAELAQKYVKEFLRIAAPGGLVVFQLPTEFRSIEGQGVALEPLPESAFRATPRVPDAPAILQGDTQIPLRVLVRNDSAVTWPAGGAPDGRFQIKLGNHWLSSNGETLLLDDGRATLPSDLQPGEEIELSLVITVPRQPGDFVLELDMVQEGVAWFRDRGSLTCRVPISITPPAHQSPQVLDAAATAAEPRMEMQGVAKAEVIALIESNGGNVIDIQDDLSSGREWQSYVYYVRKAVAADS